ncbi:hypothetical protein [Xanthomonas oryzae]|uniref:hypothetical protein n=1 Tax=Xanthomonas oryzae TaxID=347 RepID=UPI00117E5C1B|nr:hypothetical protein [Xanthomonas oryzae]QIE17497.1 hypothetical protein IXO1088_022760 [Xanthomonas oryzae pv. oryzae]UXV99235.1 hypothetical protein IXO1104_21630 [Xanthomonas oryzae pv. oryzae]UZK20279.1 hypothetical protein DXO233_21320 [Xanthomonas oryzae pv. oryzae]
MFRLIILIIILLNLTSCFGFKPFQPNPDEYEMWSAVGASQLDVKKAMLECGYPTPFGIRSRELNIFPSPDEMALTDRCMKKSGFFYKDRSYNFCRTFHEISACQPDAIIPHRELSRRINSQYCKKYTKADACAP